MVIELQKDNLADYMSEERLLVVVEAPWCGACKKLRVHLDKIGDEFTIVALNGERHLRSAKFIPGKIKFYPTLGYYEKGYYIGPIQQLDIINGLKIGKIWFY